MINKTTFSIFLLFFVSLSSCELKKSHIYKLEKFTEEKLVEQGTFKTLFIKEIFIVSNPTENEDKLKCQIKNFNDSTMIQDLLSERSIQRKRVFYQETNELNMNFEEKNPNESGYFDKVDLSGHYTDKLVETSWVKRNRFSGHYTWYLDKKTGVTTHFSYDLP